MRRYRAILPEPLLGSGELTARFRLPATAVPDESTVRASLPLVLPVASRVARQTLVVNAVDTLAVDVLDDAWRHVNAEVASHFLDRYRDLLRTQG